MSQFLLVLAVGLTAGAVIFGVTVVITSRESGLRPVEPDGRAIPLPSTGRWSSLTWPQVRFDTACGVIAWPRWTPRCAGRLRHRVQGRADQGARGRGRRRCGRAGYRRPRSAADPGGGPRRYRRRSRRGPARVSRCGDRRRADPTPAEAADEPGDALPASDEPSEQSNAAEAQGSSPAPPMLRARRRRPTVGRATPRDRGRVGQRCGQRHRAGAADGLGGADRGGGRCPDPAGRRAGAHGRGRG